MNIQFVGSPNYHRGRDGHKPIAIVNHITAGRFPGCLTWMQNPQSEASANYLVTKAGNIFQLVRDEDTAWANGKVQKPSWALLQDGTNPNKYTLSIEHEGLAGDALTEAQYQASLWLHNYLIKKHDIPADNDHIIGHYRIDSVERANCPGPGFPWGRLFADLKRGDNMPEEIKTVTIKVGGKEIEAVEIGGRTIAPVRAIAEALGRTVEWDEKNQTVVIK